MLRCISTTYQTDCSLYGPSRHNDFLFGVPSCLDVKRCNFAAMPARCVLYTQLSARNTRRLPREHRHLYFDHERSHHNVDFHLRPSSKIRCISIDVHRWKADPERSVAASTMRYQICPRLCNRLTSAVLQGCGQWLSRSSYSIARYHRQKRFLNAFDKMAAEDVGK